MTNEEMREIERSGAAEELTGALAMASPHRLPPELRARVLRAVEARAGRAGGFSIHAAWLRPLGAGAALAILVALLVWNLQLQQGLAGERRLLQQLRDSANESLIFEIVDSPGSQKVMLRAAGPQRPGEDPPYGKLYTNANHTQVVLMAGRLPNTEAGREYHVYVTDRSGATVHAGALRIDATGFGYLIYDSGTRGPSYAAARVYLQQPRSDTPGGTLVLTFDAR